MHELDELCRGELGEFAMVRSLILMIFAIGVMRLHDLVELTDSSYGEPAGIRFCAWCARW